MELSYSNFILKAHNHNVSFQLSIVLLMPLSCFHCVSLTSENSSISERGNVDEESILHHKNEKNKECEIQYEKVEQVCLIFSELILCNKISDNIYIDQC